MKITKSGTEYLIQTKGTNGKTLTIFAYISDEGITLFTRNHQEDFTFIDTKPEILAKLGKMFIKISKI